MYSEIVGQDFFIPVKYANKVEPLKQAGYSFKKDKKRNITEIESPIEIGRNGKYLREIESYVQNGSYIEMVAEDQTRWRWVFKDGKVNFVTPQIIMNWSGTVDFECETTDCVYNHDGMCRFARVHECDPHINDYDGCTSGVIEDPFIVGYDNGSLSNYAGMGGTDKLRGVGSSDDDRCIFPDSDVEFDDAVER